MDIHFVVFENHSNRIYHIEKCFLLRESAQEFYDWFLDQYEHDEVVNVNTSHMGLNYLCECYFQHPKYMSRCCLVIARQEVENEPSEKS